MSDRLLKRLSDEVGLVERFTTTYRVKFAQLIDRLNSKPAATDLQCIRMCVEAVDMMMASQTHLARVIREMATEPAEPALKAA